jgi:hypothetical protein
MALMTNKKFDFHDLPVAFFSDNIKANEMRNQVIKNQVRISECEQGDLENTFFSDENIELINKQLILKVFKKTQIKITPQSKNDLTIGKVLKKNDVIFLRPGNGVSHKKILSLYGKKIKKDILKNTQLKKRYFI